MNTTYALITGGSQGIGRALALECVHQGIGVLIVALPNEHLEDTLALLQQAGTAPVAALGLDLRRPNASDTIANWVEENGYRVQYLINNVGFGYNGIYDSRPLQFYLDMLQLNNVLLVAMVHRMLPHLRQVGQARILNVSSLEAYLPLPFKAVYSATKSFIYTYSLSLRTELADEGISVSVLSPGPVVTNEAGLKRIQSQGKSSQLIVMYPDAVAKIALAGMLNGQRVIVPGRMSTTVFALARLLPVGWKMHLLAYLFRNYRYADPALKADEQDESNASQSKQHTH